MVEPEIIDEVVEELSASEKALEHTLGLMQEQQPVLLSYLFAEQVEAFTQAEREFLLFLSAVIWKSVYRVWGPQKRIDEERLTDAEEQNWELITQNPARKFRERLDIFFTGPGADAKEELLAFIEDALLDDDESPVTAEGREPLFVTLKTVVDCLVEPNLN